MYNGGNQCLHILGARIFLDSTATIEEFNLNGNHYLTCYFLAIFDAVTFREPLANESSLSGPLRASTSLPPVLAVHGSDELA